MARTLTVGTQVIKLGVYKAVTRGKQVKLTIDGKETNAVVTRDGAYTYFGGHGLAEGINYYFKGTVPEGSGGELSNYVEPAPKVLKTKKTKPEAQAAA
jgi:hypothetical protein